MARSFYETLGVRPEASPEEIRSAYRRLVLKYHPDRSSDPKSAEMFLLITEAYDTLSDHERRSHYDFVTKRDAKLRAETQKLAATSPPSEGRVRSEVRAKPSPQMEEKLSKLSSFYRRGQISAAEAVAYEVLTEDPQQPMVYAILGDLARSRGELNKAAKMYAFAAQFDPTHPEYEQRHIEMLNASMKNSVQVESVRPLGFTGIGIGAIITLICGYYLIPAKEAPLLPNVAPISSFTFGLVVMALFAGLSIGVSLGVGGLLDRFSSTAFDSVGRMSPALALGLVSAVNFWAASALYVVLGMSQQSFQYSASRLVTAVALATLIFGVCAVSSPSLNPIQTVLWSGNLIYLSSLAGWLVSDAFRRF